MLLPPGFAALLPAADRARLRALQAGLVEHLEAAEARRDSPSDASSAEPDDQWQRVADLAQWYLKVSAEPLAASVYVDVDRCTFQLGEAAQHGARPRPEGVTQLHRRWLASSRWPCFPGDDEPPLLRGG